MTIAQRRTLGRLTKQLQGFLDAVEADDGMAVLALLAAAGDRGAHVIARGQDPGANRSRLLEAICVVEQTYRNVAPWEVGVHAAARLVAQAPAGVM